jgi:hypothetical protein
MIVRLVRQWLDAWRDRPVAVQSPLSVEEAVARLDAGLSRSLWRLPTTPSIIRVRGEVAPEYVRLTPYSGGRNSWRPVLDGRIVASPAGGSELVGTIGLHAGVRVFCALWFGGVILFQAVFIIAALRHLMTQGSAELVGPAFIPLLMLAFGVALTSFGFWSGARDERYLLAWLRSRLDADSASDGAAATRG